MVSPGELAPAAGITFATHHRLLQCVFHPTERQRCWWKASKFPKWHKCQTRLISIQTWPFATPLVKPQTPSCRASFSPDLAEGSAGSFLTWITLLHMVNHLPEAFSLGIRLSPPFLQQLNPVSSPPPRSNRWDNWSWPHYGSLPSAGETWAETAVLHNAEWVQLLPKDEGCFVADKGFFCLWGSDEASCTWQAVQLVSTETASCRLLLVGPYQFPGSVIVVPHCSPPTSSRPGMQSNGPQPELPV